jgi:hypothetical protein
VDDPETKEKLRAEKRAREEAEKSSSRAQRLAARRSSLPAVAKPESAVEKKPTSKRRKTTNLAQDVVAGAAPARSNTGETIAVTETTTHKRTISTSSRFHEELDNPSGIRTTTSTEEIVRRTEVSVSTAAVSGADEGEEDGVLPLLDGASEAVVPGKGGLKRTASKGKEAVKSFGEAARKLLGAGKLKQSTLNFARLSES